MKKILQVATVVVVAFMPSKALALSYNANTDGITAPAGSFWTSSGPLGTKSQVGYTVLGVQGGASGNEIDLGEWLQINLTSPGHFSTLTLGLLFDGPEYGDLYEIAAATADGTVTYQLQATGLTTATWSGPGSVINLSPAEETGAAVWQITNPFGSMLVSDVKLYPVSSNPTGNESDFGLQSFSVPDGGSTLALLGASFLGLGLLRRKLA